MTTSENPLDEEEPTENVDNILVDESLITTSEWPIVGTIDDLCRGDDKVRCGSTSVYICDIQKCDGTPNCPNGEDEENCPSSSDPQPDHEEDDGSAEDEIVEPPKSDKAESEYEDEEEIEVETSTGDFSFIIFQNI